MRDRVKGILAITISIVTIALIIKLTDVELRFEDLKRLNFGFLLIALILQFLFWVLWAFRLKLITKTLGRDLDFFYSLEVTLSSMFFASITPSSAGGEPIRVKLVGEVCDSYGIASAVVLIERLLDAIFFAIALPILVILTDFSVGFGFKVAGVFTAFLLTFLFLLYTLFKDPERLDEIIIKFSDRFLSRFVGKRVESFKVKALKEAKNFRKALIEIIDSRSMASILIFITVVMWVLGFLIPSFVLLAMNKDPFYVLSITSQLIIVVLSLIPLTPGSSGIAEVSMAYLYSNFVPHSALGVLVAIWRVITYYTNLVFGFIVTLKMMGFKR
jgi:uncharacterized protein (TIRG00374 family)